MCNELLRACSGNDIQTWEFEDLKKFYFYNIKSNTEIFPADDSFVNMFQYEPLLPCISKQIRFFFMQHKNDPNQNIYLFKESALEEHVELYAYIPTTIKL